jgi:hypothetical protein
MTKTKITRLLPALACGLVLLLASHLSAGAQEATPAGSWIDVVIVLDDSGSMATCWPWSNLPRLDTCRPSENPPSDPHELRYSAARLLTQLAGDGDRVAVIRFNAGTQDIIGRLQAVGNRNNRQSLVEAIQPPGDYLRAGGYTRIDLGLSRAVQILKAAEGSPRPSYVILLTDGVPTQPDGSRPQDQAIKQSVAELEGLGAQVFPVFLCNDKAGCPDDAFIQRTMGKVPDKARTADELLQVFSAVFAKMKPDLHVIDRRNADGDIEFTIREAHGAQQLVIVARSPDAVAGEQGGLVALKRDGNPETISRAYQEPNILVNVIEAGKLAAGVWTVTTKGDSSFVVAQTETVPELIYPPPSVAGSAAAPHYVPAGKPVLILAKIAGPGGSEPLRLNDSTLLEPLAAGLAPGDALRWTVLPGGAGDFTLQAGEDTSPLEIRRTFRLETRADLPTVVALSPLPGAACLPEEPCVLKAGFGPGSEVEDLQAMVYVTDETPVAPARTVPPGSGKLVYSAPMTCIGRECADPAQAFKREDGHTYTVRFLLQGRSNGVLFGDWTEATLAMEPAVYLRGLPLSLNLKTQPDGGWPVTVVAGTTEDLGRLQASIVLTRTDDSMPVADVQVDFAADVSGAGEQQASLKVSSPTDLRPGHYEGLISFTTDRPSTERKVRLPAPISVSLNLSRPAAHISDSAVDFGTVIFDTSPNFRVNETAYMPVQFDDSLFNLTPEQIGGSCPGLELVAGPPEMSRSPNTVPGKIPFEGPGQASELPLTLRSSGPIAPQTCSGTFALHGPSGDYDVQPETPLSWRLVIPAVEWEVLGVERGGSSTADANLGRLGKAGERSTASLRVRYTGKPPFSLQLSDLSAAVEDPVRFGTERAGIAVGKDDLVLVAATAAQQAVANDEYRVPVELLVRRSLPHASPLASWLQGTDYSGKLSVKVAGLPSSAPQEVSFRLHNPSVYQRYVQPFYRLLLPGVATIPLSVIVPLLLFVFIWKRKKDASVERLMRRPGLQPLAGEDAVGVGAGPAGEPPRIPVTASGLGVAATQASGPPRWTARREHNPRPSDARVGRGYRIPQRQVRPAKGAGATAPTPTTRPAPASVPPPRRRAGTSRPTS